MRSLWVSKRSQGLLKSSERCQLAEFGPRGHVKPRYLGYSKLQAWCKRGPLVKHRPCCFEQTCPQALVWTNSRDCPRHHHHHPPNKPKTLFLKNLVCNILNEPTKRGFWALPGRQTTVLVMNLGSSSCISIFRFPEFLRVAVKELHFSCHSRDMCQMIGSLKYGNSSKFLNSPGLPNGLNS